MRAIRRTVDAIGDRWRRFSDRSGLSAAIAATSRLRDGLGQVWERISGVSTALGGMAAIGIGVAAKIVHSFAGIADEAGDVAARLNVGVRKLTAWQYAARTMGIENETLTGALDKLTINLGKAVATSSPAGQLFARLGVRVRDGATKRIRPLADLLPEIIDGLNKIKDPAIRAAAAATLFGKSGWQDMIEFTSKGSKGLAELVREAERVGAVIGDDTVDKAEAYNKAWAKMVSTFSGLRNAAGSALLPVLTELFERMSAFVVENGPEIRNWFEGFAAKLPARIESLRRGFGELMDKLQPVVNLITLLSNTFGGSNVTIAAVAIALGSLLLPAIISVTTAMWALNVALWANPIGLIIGLIVAVVAALAYFALKVDDGKIKLTGFGETLLWISTGPARFLQWYLEKVTQGIANWGRMVEWVKGIWNDLWSGLESGFNRALGWISEFASRISGMVPDWAKRLFGGDMGGLAMLAGPAGGAISMMNARETAAQTRRQDGEVRVKVDFNNLPSGARVRTEERGAPGVEVNQGYAFGS